LKLEIQDLILNLNVNWKISRGATNKKENFLIKVSDKHSLGLSEVAFNVRYGENRERILEEFYQVKERLEKASANYLETLDSLNIASSLRFALESAYFHYEVGRKGQALYQLLGIEPAGKDAYPTSFSIPIMEPTEAIKFITERDLQRFLSLKIKINKEMNSELVLAVLKHYRGKIRIDGNECFEKASAVMEMLKHLPEEEFSRIEFIEQPIPAALREEINKLKVICPLQLMADESITDNEVSEYLCEGFHSINLKLMKTGGLRKFKEQIQAAQNLNLKIMLGCMIESTLGLSYALNFAPYADYLDLDGFLLLAEEPFKLISESNGLLTFT
jgi:L-Ala-D/L-Glu epimerase